MKKQIKKNQEFNLGRTINWGVCNDCNQPNRFSEDCFSCKNYAPFYEQIDMSIDEFIATYAHLISDEGYLEISDSSWDALQDSFVFKFKTYNLYAELRDYTLHIQRFYKNIERVVSKYTVNFLHDDNRYGSVMKAYFDQKEDINAKRLAMRIGTKMKEIRERYLILHPNEEKNDENTL